jgi:nucleotide-binding universal stress UspA family protein
MGHVVVGVDGSGGSIAALRWAAVEAGRRGGLPVRVVHVWEYPLSAVAPSPIGSAVPPADVMQGAAEVALETILAEADLPVDVVVERVVTEGSAAKVLLAEAQGAEMLVVGTRGRGGFTGLLLGSVATQVVHHTRVPTIVVPPED